MLGLDNPSGPIYLAWSGPGADLSELAIIGGLINIARRHNCAVHRCWRVGRHRIDGTDHMVCRHHHPDGPLRAEDISRLVADSARKAPTDG